MSDFELRLENLESNYSRMADGMKRIGDATEATQEAVNKLNRTMVGYMDDDSNEFIQGYVQKLDAVEKIQTECLNGKRKSKAQTFNIVKDIAVGVAIIVILAILGLK